MQGGYIMTFLELYEKEKEKEYFKKLSEFVNLEYKHYTVYPRKDNIFAALKACELDKIKVVILGQDPYHNENQAHGLSFSVPPSQKEIPPSLVNIYKELASDVGCYIPNNGYLEKWAKQGVLLLNTVLTVRAHQANSHANKGWEIFTDKIIETLNNSQQPLVFLLWGKPAQQKIKLLNNKKHLILTAPHPSPLSSYRGFFGCKHFSKTNKYLIDNNLAPIDWQIENI